MRTKHLLPTALVLALAAGPAAAQTAPLQIEFGYRFLDVTGNRDEYRTQINEHEGFLLRNVTFATSDFGGKTSWVDHFRVDGSELGAGPAGALRLEAGRAGIYALRFFYRRAELYSALPDFANPLFPAVIPGQHTTDRVRHIYDAELEVLPGGLLTPILGYTRNTYSGPGRTTYHVGQDEFRLSSDLRDTDQEYRVGAAFDAGFVTGRFVQGWRQFRETQTLALAPGEKNGNNAGPVLGVPVSLNDLNRETSTKTDTPSTSAIVTGRFGSRVKIIGSYQRASAEADTDETEAFHGSLVSFQISRFFAGLNETASTKAKATFWTGAGRAEISVADGLDISGGWSRRHRYVDGFALVSSLYLNTVTFTGQDPKNLLVLLQAQNAMDRFDNVFDVAVAARGLGPVALKAGFAETTQDVTVTPDLSEIVVPGNQGGSFSRRIQTYTGAVSYAVRGLTLAADYQRDHANDPIVRTDFLDRDRYRLRLSWSGQEFLRVSANGRLTNTSNDRTGIGYDARLWEYGGELELLPVKAVSLRFSTTKYQVHSTILYRIPDSFATDVSDHRESGLSLEGGIALALPGVRLDGSYARFTNKGSYPFTIDRARAGGEIPVTPHLAFVAEWLRDKYNDVAQNTGNLGKYDANRYGLYVRWSP